VWLPRGQCAAGERIDLRIVPGGGALEPRDTRRGVIFVAIRAISSSHVQSNVTVRQDGTLCGNLN
jgi:hypothetical protein